MDHRRRVVPVAVLSLVALAVLPGLASAHGASGSRFDAPLPLPLLLAGAGATVALTALWLASGGATSRTLTPFRRREGSRRQVLTVPASVAGPARRVLAALFFGAVLVAMASGITGRQVAAENTATVFTWPVWFHGLALLAILAGTPWRLLSPWRALYRALVRLEGGPIALRAYPAALGAWPGVAGFVLLIGIGENLTAIPRSPRLTAATLGAYALAMIGGTVLFGPAWLHRADPLAVLYGLLGRVSGIRFRATDDGGYDLLVRSPWQGCLDPVEDVSLAAFAVAAVYTVSFDGFTETRAARAVFAAVRNVVGAGPGAALAVYLAGLAAFLLVYAATSRLADRLGGSGSGGPAGGGDGWTAGARRFAPTVLPIAAAYEVAHSYPYVLRNLGRLPAMVLRPVVPGASPVDPLAWLPVSWFWGSQVVLIVLGHVVAVVAAHLVAVDRYASRTRALRGHLPFVVLMVGYTVLSLWIVSQPVVAE